MRFNDTTSTPASTRNFAGGEGFLSSDPRTTLYRLTVNNLFEDTYYESDEESFERFQAAFEACADEDPAFPLRLAMYARNELYLRTVPQVLLALAAGHGAVELDGRRMTGCRGVLKEEAKAIVPAICRRADEPATVIAVWDRLHDTGLPRPLKRGLEAALQGFQAYHLAKYRQASREVSLYDVFNRVHPRPTSDEQADTWERLMQGDLDASSAESLRNERTWETVISEEGNTAEAWRSVLGDIGLFARIRNLRNMLEAGLSAAEVLGGVSVDQVRGSMLYPFRFYQAYRAALPAASHSDRPFLLKWFETAVTASVNNLPDGLGDSYVAVDLSGSMDHALSPRSTLTYKQIGVLFGAVLAEHGAAVGAFGDTHEQVTFGTGGVFENMEAILDCDSRVGHSTNGHLAVEQLTETRTEVDRLFVLTDCQMWDSDGWGAPGAASFRASVERYRREVGPLSVYTIDLSSYGHATMPEDATDVYQLGGWNERVFDYVNAVENDADIIADIEGYQP